MEKRRLQKTGGSSFCITLPKSWVEQHRLSDKSVVMAVPRSSGALVITAENRTERRRRQTIDLDESDLRMARREAIACYIAGADEICLRSGQFTQEKRDACRQIGQLLTGFEICEETAGSITLKNILGAAAFPYQETVRRMFPMTRSMFSDAVRALTEQDRDLAKDVAARDFDVDRAYFVIARLTASLISDRTNEDQAGVSLTRAYYLSRLAYQMERIADHAAKIADLSARKAKAPRTSLLRPLASVTGRIVPMLDETAFLAEPISMSRIHQMLDELTDRGKDIMAMLTRAASGCVAAEVVAVDSLSRLRGYTTNMAEVALEQVTGHLTD